MVLVPFAGASCEWLPSASPLLQFCDAICRTSVWSGFQPPFWPLFFWFSKSLPWLFGVLTTVALCISNAAANSSDFVNPPTPGGMEENFIFRLSTWICDDNVNVFCRPSYRRKACVMIRWEGTHVIKKISSCFSSKWFWCYRTLILDVNFSSLHWILPGHLELGKSSCRRQMMSSEGCFFFPDPTAVIKWKYAWIFVNNFFNKKAANCFWFQQ